MDREESNAEVRYERKDIRLRGLLAVIVVTIGILAGLGYGVWRFFWWQAGVQEATKPSQNPLAPGLSPKLPPEPRLEQLDRMAHRSGSDVYERLAAQEKVLGSYGPAEEKGFVHIPIQQAIKATAGTLPVRKRSQDRITHDNGLLESGESNSGRMFRGELPCER